MTYYQKKIRELEATVNFPAGDLLARLAAAKLFIETNYSSDINLVAVARAAFFSRFHFIRLFKSVYGRTPHQVLITTRINSARLLLLKGESVAATVQLVGFASTTSFNALFKKYTGVSPKAFATYKFNPVPAYRLPLTNAPGYSSL